MSEEGLDQRDLITVQVPKLLAGLEFVLLLIVSLEIATESQITVTLAELINSRSCIIINY